MQLFENFFCRVVSHLKEEIHSLHEIRRFKGGGVEGWFKVEVVAALGDQVTKVQNKGPDLQLTDGSLIELKADCGLDAAYIRKGALKNKVPCLFLGYGGNLKLLNTKEVELVVSEQLSDGHDDWVVGIIRTKT